MTVAHTPPRRLAYLGTPAIAVPPLHALVEAGFDIEIVVTNEDARRGRGKELSPTPVKAAALELGLPVSHRVADVLDTTAELGVVVAFGHLIPTSVLDRMPMVNIHYSLLPRWRGAAPLERAILAGDDVTGVCLMEVAEALDAGGVFAQAEVPIGPDDTLDELRAALVEASLPLLIDNLKAGLGEAVPQDGEITWAKKFDPADFDIDFTRPAHEVHGLVRLGRAFTRFRASDWPYVARHCWTLHLSLTRSRPTTCLMSQGRLLPTRSWQVTVGGYSSSRCNPRDASELPAMLGPTALASKRTSASAGAKRHDGRSGSPHARGSGRGA